MSGTGVSLDLDNIMPEDILQSLREMEVNVDSALCLLCGGGGGIRTLVTGDTR